MEARMPCGYANGEPLSDIEKGHGDGRTVAPPTPAADTAMAAQKAALDKVATKIVKCIVRGLLVLLWVYLVDLFRRFVTANGEVELIMIIGPLTFLALGVSVIFFFVMESLDECISPTSEKI